jgi:hypothetical protein
MNVPKLGADISIHVGGVDPTYIPKNPLSIPGLATINGPLIVGGLVDGVAALNAKKALVNIIPGISAGVPAIQISALGDGKTPYPGVGIEASALNFNFNSFTGFNLKGVNTNIDSILNIRGPKFEFKLGTMNGPSIFNKIATFNADVIFNKGFKTQGTNSINGTLTLTGVGDVATNINLAKTLPAKPFDINHPSKPGYRLRHISLEGPEICVFYRGKGKGKVIFLPEYWKDLVDETTITVHLTSIKQPATMYVEKIENNQIWVSSDWFGTEYYYYVVAERKDLDKLIVEYEGTSPKDYPGQDFIGIKDGI